MWILENEGEIFQGKRLWLRPGKRFLFGRTQTEEGNGFVVADKTISRQHLEVNVEEASEKQWGDPRARSKVTIRDRDTKIGTLVNGEQIRGKSYVLENDENVVTMGRYKYHFRFTWVPVTFSFSFTTKEQRANPYTGLYELLGPLDIKVLVDYESGVTTHLVAKKRNTSKGLQALIDGKYIVHNDSFIQAVLSAATSSEGPSLLEQDFEANFPNALEYLPPRGEEPTQRDHSAYAPRLDRRDLFDGYTFVFYDRRQFETLLPPITQGKGKAMLREAVPNQTQLEEFVTYVKGVAGEKGLGEFGDGSEGKGVVVVRFNPVKGEGTEWFSEFGRQVALLLNHRLVEQNEFLDAILGSDASVLRRPLEIELSGVVGSPPSTAPIESTQNVDISEPAPPPEPSRRGRSRRVPAARFKGFDDDDDFGTPLSSIAEYKVAEPTPIAESQSQGLFVSQNLDTQAEREPSAPPEPALRSSRRKRSAPSEEQGIVELMAPAATALKKRRIAEESARRERGESTPPPPLATKRDPVIINEVKKKAKPDIDVMEVARQQREKAEELAREEREALVRDLDGMDIEAIRDLAIIEEMEVKRIRPPPRGSAQADESERWDDKWNGRKNFKRFRRQGAEGGNRRGMNKVIVQLEEVKKKDFGIGDDYWLENDRDSQRKKKGKSVQTQEATQTQSQPRGRHKSSTADQIAGTMSSEVDDDLTHVPETHIISSDDDESELTEQPGRVVTTRSQRSQKLSDKTNEVQNLPSTSKRPASMSLTKPAPAKRARQALVRKDDSDDSDDDGLTFKFRRR